MSYQGNTQTSALTPIVVTGMDTSKTVQRPGEQKNLKGHNFFQKVDEFAKQSNQDQKQLAVTHAEGYRLQNNAVNTLKLTESQARL